MTSTSATLRAPTLLAPWIDDTDGEPHVMPFNLSVRTAMGKGSKQAIKNQLLSQIGEFVTRIGVPSLGFRTVIDLNDPTTDLTTSPSCIRTVRPRVNHEDGDFLLERNDQWFLTSTKARNKFVNLGHKLNERFRLETNRPISLAKTTASGYGAQFAFVVVQVARNNYSAYFGTHAQLISLQVNGKKINGNAVNMTSAWTRHYEKIALDERHTIPYDLISNADERRAM